MKIRLNAVIEIDADAWENIHGGEQPLTAENATAYVEQIFDVHGRVTEITKTFRLIVVDQDA
ncbi:hypothetical protein GCM10010145_12000 [Streptomyces ruber]|uniref:Uncharacterized protein n=2 Tax=Streptomyces TaxID=1883 RepID=A0A918B9B9_9ACTN|nr:hypothetical protein [Streptomyces ruber]GGQ44929.1 hypothetical protein GCM10010145_12000 [Streptomyces ruber]